jgi:transposase
VNEVLAALDGDFSKAYADSGRPSIAPERLLRALLPQAFYTIRSERQLMEQLDYNLLYRWFVGLGVDEPVWVPTVFTKNRDRLLEADVARKFLAELMNHRELRGLLSDEHFSVDGTQIAAWASMNSFKPKDGSGDPPGPGRNGERDFHGRIVGSAATALTSLLSFSITSTGVFLGAPMPYQALASSPTVEISSIASERVAVVTANARSMPAVAIGPGDRHPNASVAISANRVQGDGVTEEESTALLMRPAAHQKC